VPLRFDISGNGNLAHQHDNCPRLESEDCSPKLSLVKVFFPKPSRALYPPDKRKKNLSGTIASLKDKAYGRLHLK
jgi:hypothetical protein